MASLWSRWPRAAADAASWALAAAVFAFLDVLDALLCLVYALVDGVLEESPVRCYCHYRSPQGEEDEELSDTLYVRRSGVRDALVRLLVVGRARAPCNSSNKWRSPSPRWSDCACESCVAWRGSGGRLHVVVKEPDQPAAADYDCNKDDDAAAAAGTTTTDNAIFLHGFSSSSSFWAETVFREGILSRGNCRLLAVDLLGFGQSPKPGDSMYRLRDHVEAIERSLIEPLGLTSSFHLVAHSMGCVVALALAAKHPDRVKSITLVAPPYFYDGDGDGDGQKKKAISQVALSRLAEKKLWPPLLFGSAVMSWYEHVGRTVCLVVCKNHRLWERLLLTTRRGRDFRLRDLTRHTHHSAWHTMHNVICGGARMQDANLEAVRAAGVPVQAIHGVNDRVVPVECSRHLKAKLPTARIRVMDGCDHATVVLGRERDFAHDLIAFWSAAASG